MLALTIVMAMFLVGGYFLLQNYESQKSLKVIPTIYPSPTANSEQKVYESDIYHFKVTVPKNLTLDEDRWPSVEFTSEVGNIIFGFNGTNYQSAKEYVDNHPHDIVSKMVSRKDTDIGGYEVVIAQYEDRKSYLLYSDYAIYIFSTTSPELYDELDQIVQSFEYTGD